MKKIFIYIVLFIIVGLTIDLILTTITVQSQKLEIKKLLDTRETLQTELETAQAYIDSIIPEMKARSSELESTLDSVNTLLQENMSKLKIHQNERKNNNFSSSPTLNDDELREFFSTYFEQHYGRRQ